MKNNQINVIIVVVTVLVLFAAFGVFSWLKYDRAASELESLKQQQILDGQEQETAEKEVEPEEQADPGPIGGQTDEHGCLLSAGYSWCPSTEKCQRMWEEYCEEYKEQYRSDLYGTFGDVGENPPEETEDWNEFVSEEYGFKFKYPENLKTVEDEYGWSNSVIHLIDKTGGQSYDVTFEVWDDEDDPADQGRMGSAVPYFSMLENPNTGEFISMTCWNPDSAEDCESIYLTLTTQLN